MEQPVYFWTPDIAPAGIAFYDGKLIPGVAWQPVCRRAGGQTSRAAGASGRARRRRRAAAHRSQHAHPRRPEGPDGSLYVMTDGNEGAIVRLIPATSK